MNVRNSRVLRLFAGDRKSSASQLRAAAVKSFSGRDDTPNGAQTGRGSAISPDYYSRKQLKHARNAALTALIWAAVFVLAVVQAWVAQ